MELKVFVHVVTYRVPNLILAIVPDTLYLFIYLLFERLFIWLCQILLVAHKVFAVSSKLLVAAHGLLLWRVDARALGLSSCGLWA